ncbi:uncharacterized protein TRAVEDRAFT_42382 [Trametes versicolor FP-101664 SS1]|uniref:uncharacterized protein n=1 Tax=Trametes versicolor (strain FP-101664) TaxID=717944 RepID=UPI0004623337|nr:uncharacterized protein TRAVEDRAFT_42382 [Trametes versicolor FP-101664 SS1]EIW64983.1 hypothetical protein TRAVEDRAFT_42382 [Trametes versicolor FP-101664 SS1]
MANSVREANTTKASRQTSFHPQLRIWPVDDYQYPSAAPLRTTSKVRWSEDIEYIEYSPLAEHQGYKELVNGRSGSEISPSVGTSKPSAEKATASSEGNTGDRVYIGGTPPSLRTLRHRSLAWKLTTDLPWATLLLPVVNQLLRMNPQPAIEQPLILDRSLLLGRLLVSLLPRHNPPTMLGSS